MAIDPLAPIAPILPSSTVGNSADPATALLALARAQAALANSASVLGAMAGTAQAETSAAPGKPPTSDAHAASDRAAPDPLAAAVRAAAAHAAPVQSGLAPIMADLRAVADRLAAPPSVQRAAQAVLDKALATDRPVTATALRAAVDGSGVFLEAHLARANAPQPAATDMKAALLVFRAVVSTWLAKAPSTAPASPGSAPTDSHGPMPSPASTQAQTPAGYAANAVSRAPERSEPTADLIQDSDSGAINAQAGAGRAPSSILPGALSAPAASTPSPSPTAPIASEEVQADGSARPPDAARPEASPEPTAPPARALAPPSPTVPDRPMLMVGLIEDDAFALPPLPGDGQEVLDLRAGASLVAARAQPPLKPPPPYPGGPMAAQAATASDLTEDLPQAELARRLLKGADGAIARQELMQIASLPDSRPETERLADAKGSRWVFDLPFQTPQGVAVAQFEVSRDGGGGGAGGDRDIERTWRARFSLDVEPLGPIHVQIALTGAVTRVGLWAERPEAMARLQAGEDALSLALRAAELTPEVAVHAGAPAIAPIAVGRFVDRES